MALKKQERKERYKEILGLMLQGKNKEAFGKLCVMCGTDTGSYLLTDYDEAIAQIERKEAP